MRKGVLCGGPDKQPTGLVSRLQKIPRREDRAPPAEAGSATMVEGRGSRGPTNRWGGDGGGGDSAVGGGEGDGGRGGRTAAP